MRQKSTLEQAEYGMKVLEIVQKYLEELETTVNNQHLPEVVEEQLPKSSPKPTHQDLENILHEIAGVVEKAGGIIAGGFVSAYVKWDPLRAPVDCDIWLPSGSWINEIPGWERTKTYNVTQSKNMSPDVKQITEFQKKDCPITLQVLMTRLDDVYDVVNRFDFDVSRGIISPAILKDGSMVGIRATRPEILQMIREGKTTYTEHHWDVDEEGKLNNKALNRFRRYIAKGYDIVPSASSLYTFDEIMKMLQNQTQNERKGKASYYEDNDIIPHNSLSYICNMIYRLYGCQKLDGQQKPYDVPKHIAFNKLVQDFWSSGNTSKLPAILKPRWELVPDIKASNRKMMISRMYS
jgi:hypothetical protein